ncbi:helix-turn-helix domain-containing protein [Clostridium sp. LY3-2]|uniref:helix-turn-helix domain-containing protein n=1 Tax=Clostridium sp. LY3-2 TaxID=2942482 RepID=UPI00215347EE|nr:helix-turn-helix transcriptional regulator [Clostridium sp. LY3-2]MCR6515283.1 helix-turn-helix domain-containing protein [Clostridium sp. LY3-2]
MTQLRLEHNISLLELGAATNISETTISKLERNLLSPKNAFYYYKILSDYFKVDYYDTFKLLTLPEKTIQDKILKLKALLGTKNLSDVDTLLGKYETFVNEVLYKEKNNIYINEETEKLITETLIKLKTK